MSRLNRNQRDLDCAVATATGEELRVIRRRGFSLIDLHDDNFDPEVDQRPPQFIDWDEQELSHDFDDSCRTTSLLAEVA
ncbi:hypothetical protein [Schlesneria sp.]|uniref:hypothetical protein n=1 Tax=Schlesneria sp. TaxID=2762018 RepID=UPI002EE57A5E